MHMCTYEQGEGQRKRERDLRLHSEHRVPSYNPETKLRIWCAWMAQLVKLPTLVFSSGHDLRVLR